MNMQLQWLLLACFWVLSDVVLAEAPADWQRITHGGLEFALPADWIALKTHEFEGQWGVKDDTKHQALLFSIVRDRHAGRDLQRAEKEGMEVADLGVVPVGGLSAQVHQISGQVEGLETQLKLAIIDGLLENGDQVSFLTTLIGLPVGQWQPLLDQVFASVKPTPELVKKLTGYGQHKLFDGLLTLQVRNNWEISDFSDTVSWEPPRFPVYGAPLIRFARGYSLTGSNGLLSRLQQPTIERSELFGLAGWKISGTGIGIIYTTPMRDKSIPATTTVHLSDICLAKGDRFGYVITASEAQLAEHRVELDKLLASVQLHLPGQSGPCDEPVTYDWQGRLQIQVPRSWRKDQDDKFQLSWYDRVLSTGANISASITHGTTDVHPITGYDHPHETLEQLTIDGYPATHFRKTASGTDHETSIHDYYVLDARMRYLGDNRHNSPSYLTIHFSRKPAEQEPDNAMQLRVLASIRLNPAWESETPVARTQPANVIPEPDDSKQSRPAAAVKEAREAEAETVPDLARQRYEQARALRAEGALLQRQGALNEAVERYRRSLTLYPDDRLETHVRRIEQMLEGQGTQ